MDFDTVGRNELIGKLCLGCELVFRKGLVFNLKVSHSFSAKQGSGPTEIKQWQDMIAKPRQAVVVWHRLKQGD